MIASKKLFLVIVMLMTSIPTLLPLHSSIAFAAPPNMNYESASFGTTDDGQDVTRYTLTNANGHSVSVMTWGATLMDVNVPDRDGTIANVNLKFDSLGPYLKPHPFFGSTVGRFCNRIGNAKFEIDGTTYPLTANHGKHQLHGGVQSFTFQNWTAKPYQTDETVGVKFTLVSPDGQEGFPGTVTVITDYSWNDANELTVAFTATTDAPTHVNLTNHSYWNLGGAGSGTALDHVATISADEALDVDDDLIPTGKLNSLDNNPLDFRTPTALGQRIDHFAATKGYDHCYVVRGDVGTLRHAATVVDPDSGRTLEIETTQPGVQLYTGNHLPGDEGSAGSGSHEAFCLETQHYPDAPNKPSFPSTLLKPGETLNQVTVHRFGVK